ncbi:CoA-binding protein [Winogradskyella sp. 3972H.M.0a.05]|uniref:CoA-binding protein n=1 Tax=Winogradskyella sp. 3972H.M.0a.05 TaxID=2950277 RepID=UPI0033996A03
MRKKTLLLGASENPSRYSNIAIRRLINSNIDVVAIGNRKGEVEGVIIETDLKHFQDIDTVTLYLNPQRQKQYYDYVLSLSPNRVIFNPGTENMEFVKLLHDNNIDVEVACTLVLLSTNQY